MSLPEQILKRGILALQEEWPLLVYPPLETLSYVGGRLLAELDALHVVFA